MNRNIIIAIIIIIIIAVVGIFAFQPHTTTDGKLNTQINFLSESTIKNGDTLQFELKDATGTPVIGAPVTISYVHDGQAENYSIITDTQGKGYLVISGEEAGSYDVTVDFAGNDKYNACSAKQTITISEENAGTTTTTNQQETESNSTASTVKYHDSDSSQQGSDSSQSYDPNKQYVAQLYYDQDLDVYYDDFGTIHGGEYDGDEIYLLRTGSSQLRYDDGYSSQE